MNSRSLRVSAWFGIVFGTFLVFAETRRNWGDWGHWASYTFDYLFAVLLVLFGALALKGYRAARFLLAVTWALTIWLFTWSFLGHIQDIDGPTNGPIPNRELTIWIGALDVIAMVGLVCCLLSYLRRPDAAPILEVAPLHVKAGQGAAFEDAFRQAQRIIASMSGYVSHTLQHCIERPDEYILLVTWRSLEDHEVAFRGSPEYQTWKQLLHHFYDPFPVVSHYAAVTGTGSAANIVRE